VSADQDRYVSAHLARAASAPDATPARLEAVDVFQSFNRYLGVTVGEHLGYGLGRRRRWEMHPGKFVGETESASWLGGVPSAHVVHAETDQAEMVPILRVTRRDE